MSCWVSITASGRARAGGAGSSSSLAGRASGAWPRGSDRSPTTALGGPAAARSILLAVPFEHSTPIVSIVWPPDVVWSAPGDIEMLSTRQLERPMLLRKCRCSRAPTAVAASARSTPFARATRVSITIVKLTQRVEFLTFKSDQSTQAVDGRMCRRLSAGSLRRRPPPTTRAAGIRRAAFVNRVF